jgi:hypothetical protein
MLKPAEVMKLPEGKHCDGDGLWLYVKGGSRSWVVRKDTNGKRREVGLGSAKTVSLAAARQRRDAFLEQWREIGPVAENAETWAKRKVVEISEKEAKRAKVVI